MHTSAGKLRGESPESGSSTGTTRVGRHHILDLHGCPPDLLDDSEAIRGILEESAHRGMLTVIDCVIHKFAPHGVTAVVLLEESHLALHTWPELQYAAVDLFTCGTTSDPERACAYLRERFQAREFSSRCIAREARSFAGMPSSPSPEIG